MTAALHTLLQHAERQRDQALAALLQAEDAVRRHQLQADQLQGYRDEYRQRHPALGGRSASIEMLRCHEGFMQRLEQAMQQQQGQMQATHNRCASLRHALVAHETRVASVRKLLERRDDTARLAAARLDQRRSDEAAQIQQQQRRRDSSSNGSPGWRLGTESMPLN